MKFVQIAAAAYVNVDGESYTPLYALGDDGYARLFPDSKTADRLTWSDYRKGAFEGLVKSQNADGSWSGNGRWGSVGPVYSTAVALTILQLDNGVLPIYQR